MEKHTPDPWLERARQADLAAREALILRYRPFIRQVAASVCQRALDWQNDDELSIALIAFNEAIDTYDSEKGRFESHARTLIRYRLVDFFRKESRHKSQLSLDAVAVSAEADQPGRLETDVALAAHNQDAAVRERAEEIKQYAALLAEFGLTLSDVKTAAPKHSDTRARIRGAAALFASAPSLTRQFRRAHQVPIGDLISLTGLSRKVLEENRRYLVALTLLLLHPELEHLRSFAGLTAATAPKGGGFHG